MSLDLFVEGDRWRAHLRRLLDEQPDLVPVAKGNGYGFGLNSLARRTGWLGCDTAAAGTYAEAVEIGRRFDGDVMVLEPWRPTTAVVADRRLVHTVGRVEDVAAVQEQARDGSRRHRPRILLEGLTSMRRHGMTKTELTGLLASPGRLAGLRVAGMTLHLPLGGGHAEEAADWIELAPDRVWFVSHLDVGELTQLRARFPAARLRPRVGTALWLGLPEALHPRASVVDAHAVRRGDRIGYRQRRIPRDGTVLVVSGGTAHGIGLDPPSSNASLGRRARTLARGGLDAAGWALSPYLVDGRQRWFVEPPHMQVSMVFLPAGATVPTIGDQLDVRVRFTATNFDSVQLG